MNLQTRPRLAAISMPLPGESFFGPWEGTVSSLADATTSINKVLDLATPGRTLVWRGVVDAGYSLHSSLNRRLLGALLRPPEESDLVRLETRVLDSSRNNWRFDNLPALEVLAHLQHCGGPTRLIDVTFNPFIALWFAVERQFDATAQELGDLDGRLFAFDVTNRSIALDNKWGGREHPWSAKPSRWQRDLPYVWRPPNYNERIAAQNSAFLVGGVPQVSAGDNARNYRKQPGNGAKKGTWSADEVRAASSITTRMSTVTRKPQKKSTPSFTLRVRATCLSELRQFLEQSFAYRAATTYPDLSGFATHVANGV